MATLPLKGGSNFNDIIFREILKKKKKKKKTRVGTKNI